MAVHPEIVVIGSGVIGMTTALCLAEVSRDVRLITTKPPQDTTSAIAGALWGPYVVHDSRVTEWSMCTFDEVERLSADPGSGVARVPGRESSRMLMDPPPWLHRLDDFALLHRSEVPDGYLMGWTYSAPIFDMPVYLNYLDQRLRERGVRTETLRAPLRSLGDTQEAKVIINCTGLGARDLVPDPLMTSSWGLLVRVENPGIGMGFFSDYPEATEPTYFIAHENHVILGGCILPEPPNDAEAAGIAHRIRHRCSAVEPRLSRAKVLDTRTGLRPVRPAVRLERTVRDGTVIVHNYGHGGSGVTLSWGCAREVATMLGHQR